ncbi:glutaredoxin domain-containing protein [Kaarinaea lacus]
MINIFATNNASKTEVKFRGIEYLEFRVDINNFSKLEMKHCSQRVTVPQIFINGYHVGGYEELIELDQNKQLEKLL